MRIELPQVGESVTEGMIGKWLKSVGDRVEKYDPLVEVVTDKVNMEFPSPASGVLTRILAQEGDTVPMGAAIAEMAADGEDGAAESAGMTRRLSRPEAQRVDTLGTYIADAAPVGPTGSGGVPMAADDGGASDAAVQAAVLAGGTSAGGTARGGPGARGRDWHGRAGHAAGRARRSRGGRVLEAADRPAKRGAWGRRRLNGPSAWQSRRSAG